MEEKRVDFIKWFSELSNKDVPIAGGKGASLAEMYNLKIPVPPGFVVTAQAYSYFLEKTGIKNKISQVLNNLNVDDTTALNKVSKKVREIIETAEFPQEMEEEILESYEILDTKKSENDNATKVLEKSGEEPFVAVRSSATTEDLADASFAGQQETFLNVKGSSSLLEKVRECMSSLFTPRAIFYREKKGFDHSKAYLAVVVQKMVASEKSGVMFSQNPTKAGKSIVIEAVFGLGEGIVSGQIKPDHYEVDKDLDDFRITETQVSKKKIAIIKNKEGKNETIKLDEETSNKRVLDNYEIKRLAQFARQLEEHYKKPQDIEFAIDEMGIYIVQSRPITTKVQTPSVSEEISGSVLLSGLAASPGVASGIVKIIHDISELEKVEKGDVMVTEMTNPDMVVAMQKSAGIITDEGGITSHAAIVSREMGIPAVVGTDDATKKLKDGDEVTVDGNSGKIYAGKGETKLVEILPIVPTKTKIKVIADLPEGAERAAKSQAKSIGLTRLEGIIAMGGKHPLSFVKDNQMEKYIALLVNNLKKMIKPFEEMWIRSSDIRTDEYSNLEGAPKDEESNPMMGNHAIRFSLKHPEILKAEFMAIKEIADEFPDKKLGLMIPLVISVDELKQAKKIAEEVGISENIKIGIMVETPAAVQIIDDLCEEGIDFISFGTNDLTQFTLALDRNNEEVQNLFDETHPAVLASISKVIRACKKHNIETSICGQAGSKPAMAKFLVREGITSISVNADAASEISKIVFEIESENSSPEQAESPAQLPVAQQEKTENSSIPKQPVTMNLDSESFDKDIESAVLEALEEDGGDYQPGNSNGDNNIPPLNEAIPVSSESFEQEEYPSNEEIEVQVEEALKKEIKDSLGKEWKGEKKQNSIKET